MAKIHIENGIISSSADYSLYHGTSPLATIEPGGFRVQGDIIAENMIVSSSTTYMTTSFSSGNTAFGDTIADTHQFTGSLSVTGSTAANFYGRLNFRPNVISNSEGAFWIDPSYANGSLSSARIYVDSNNQLVFSRAGNDNLFIGTDGSVSGSATTTGSFGKVIVGTSEFGGGVADGVDIGLQVTTGEQSKIRLNRQNSLNNYLDIVGGSIGAFYNINASGTAAHIFKIFNVEKARIDADGNITSSGNLTVGSPSTVFGDKKLRVSGDGMFSLANGSSRAIYAEGNGGDGNYLYAGMKGADGEKLVKFGAYFNVGLGETGYVGVTQAGNTVFSGDASGSEAYFDTRVRIGKYSTSTPNNEAPLTILNDHPSTPTILSLIGTAGSVGEYIDIKMNAGNNGAGTLGTILRHERQGSGGGDFIILTATGISATPTEVIRFTTDNKVGIGTTSPSGSLHVYSGDAGGSSAIFNQADELVIENSNHAGITIKSPNDKETSVFFGDTDDSSRGGIRYDHATDKMKFQVAVTSLELTSTKISGSSSSTGSFGRIILPSAALADKSAPQLAFGDGDTGFFENGDDGLSVAIAGNRRWYFGADTIFGNDSGGPAIMAKTATATQPVYSFEGDLNTGIGKASADNMSLITGGKESLRVSSTKISGSATSTGSFGNVEILGTALPTKVGANTLNISNDAADSFANLQIAIQGSDHMGMVMHEDGTARAGVYYDNVPNNLVLRTNARSFRITNADNQFSGSATSTGSFGRVEADVVGRVNTNIQGRVGLFGTSDGNSNPPIYSTSYQGIFEKYGGTAQVLIKRTGYAPLLLKADHLAGTIATNSDYPLLLQANDITGIKLHKSTGNYDVEFPRAGIQISGSSSSTASFGAGYFTGQSLGVGTTNTYGNTLFVNSVGNGQSARFSTDNVLNYIHITNSGGANHYIETNQHSIALSADANNTRGAVQLKTSNITALNVDSSQNITLRDNKNFGSSTYSSGFGGSGYRFGLDADNLYQGEFDNLFVRGRMTIYELLINQIRASNGAIYVSDAAKVDSVTPVNSTTFKLNFDTGSGYGHPFQGGDLLKAQRFDGSGTYVSRLTVTGLAGTNGLTASLQSGDTPPSGGFEFVRVGNQATSSRQGAIYLTNSDSGAPFIDIYDGVSSHVTPTGSQYLKVRTGRLDGITSPQLGSLTGFGFYASGSAFLEGTINATAGGVIGGWDINTSTISKNSVVLDSSGIIRSATNFTSGNGFYLDSTSTNNFRVGNSGGQRLQFTGTNVEIYNEGNTKLVSLGSFNEIAGWGITTSIISSSAGNVQMDAGNSRFLIQDPNGKQRVRMGLLNANNQYGISGSDAGGNLLFKLGEAGNEIAGWGITQTVISSSDGNVQIDSGNSRFLIKSGSGERVRMGLLNNSSQYGISGSDENGNLLFKLGDAGNEIAGWRIAQGKLDFDHPTGSIAIDASNKNIAIYTGSINAARPKVVMGNLPTTGDQRYGFAVFSGSGDADISDDDSYSVLITKDKARLAGWDLVPGRLKSGTVADINGNQASIALGGGSSGRNALTANAIPTDGLFFVSASANPVFYVGSTFSYVNNELKAAGWTLNAASLTSPSNTITIHSTSKYIAIGTGGYKGTNTIYLDGNNSRMSIGQNFFYESDALTINGSATIGGWEIQNGFIRKQIGADQIILNATDNTIQLGSISAVEDISRATKGAFFSGSGDFVFKSGNTAGSNYIQGKDGNLIVSMSNFNVRANGDVSMSGEITAAGGEIAGWNISDSALSKSSVFITSSLNQAGLVITDGTDTILSVVSSSGLTDTNDLTGSKGSSPDNQFRDNEFEEGNSSGGYANSRIDAAGFWSTSSRRWDTDLAVNKASQPTWEKDATNARFFPQCAELPSGTVINASSFGTQGYVDFFRDTPVTNGLVEVSAFLRPFGWKYYGEKSGITAYCEMQITGSDNATFSSGTQTPFKPQRVLYTSKEPTRVGIKLKNKSIISSMRIRFISVHDLSRTKAKSYTLGGWTVDGLKIIGISGNPGTGGTRARTKPLVELNQQGMLLYSSKDSFIQLDEGGLEMKGNIQATDIDAQGSVTVTGSLTSNSELNIQGAVNFSTDVALALGHTNPESKIHVSESFFNGTADSQHYPDSFPIGQDVSWLKAPSGTYGDAPAGYAGDGSDPYHIGSVFRAQFDPFISDNATTGQYGFLAAYGTGHIHDSYGRTQNHMMYGELITGGAKGFVGRGSPLAGADGTTDFRMSASIGIGKVWSYNANKNQYGSDVRFAYGPNANNVGGMRQVGHRVTLLSGTTIDNVDDIDNTFYNQGFQVNRAGTINVDVDSSTGATTLGGFSAFAAYNNSDGSHGTTAGYGFWISGFSKNYISGKLGINDSTPSYALDVTGEGRFTSTLYTSNIQGDGSVAITGFNSITTNNLVTTGNVDLGNGTNDTITFTGRVDSHLLPSADSTYTIGGSSNYWSHGYIDAITTTGDITVGGDVLPSTSAAKDLGSTSYRWNNIYTTDLQLSNIDKDKGNDVDGTRGDWTLQEGDENLYVINNISGKKYKIALIPMDDKNE